MTPSGGGLLPTAPGSSWPRSGILKHAAALVLAVAVAVLQCLPRQCSCGPVNGAQVLAARAQALVHNYSGTVERLQGTLEVLEHVVVSAPGESQAYRLAAPEVSNTAPYLDVLRAAAEMAGTLEAVAMGSPAAPGTDVHVRALQAAAELSYALQALPSFQQSYPMTRRAIVGALLKIWLTSRIPLAAWPPAIMEALFQVMVEVRMHQAGGGGAGREGGATGRPATGHQHSNL